MKENLQIVLESSKSVKRLLRKLHLNVLKNLHFHEPAVPNASNGPNCALRHQLDMFMAIDFCEITPCNASHFFQ